MKILVTLMHPRSCQNILGAIEKIARRGDDVYVVCYSKMSSSSPWPDTSPDPRIEIRRRLEVAGVRRIQEINGDGFAFSSGLRSLSSGHDVDLVIMDRNKAKLHWGTPLVYQEFRRRGIPVVGCQEGSVDDGEAGLKPISEGLGLIYDYCFCIGEFDRDILIRRNPQLRDRIFAVGLPSNDALSEYFYSARVPKHVMIVPSWTEPAGETQRFSPMKRSLFEASGLFDLMEAFSLPLLIKEKTRDQFAFKDFESEDIMVTMDETCLDQMVADSACIVGAPSTLLFKGMQLGIPTAVLSKPRMGQLGIFREYDGLTDSSKMQVRGVLEYQKRNGRIASWFIERAVSGGSKFRSTDLFISAVEQVANAREIFTGSKSWKMGFKKGVAQRHPRAYFAAKRLFGRDSVNG